MEILALLNTLQTLSAEHPLGFAVIVILVMVTEGLVLVGLLGVILKIFTKPGSRTR